MSCKQIGKQSICFKNPPVISGAASIVGEKEGEGPYGEYFDKIETDPKVGGDTWEEAEGKLQEEAASWQSAMQVLQKKISDIWWRATCWGS